MTDIPLQFSIIDTNSTIVKKRKQLSSSKLFNNYQRNLAKSSHATVPIITLSSFGDLREKFLQMASTNKSKFLSTAPLELGTTKVQLRPSHSGTLRKSSLSFPATVSRPTTSHRSNNQQQNSRHLHIGNTPLSSLRTVSARTSIHPPLKQQKQLPPPSLSRPYSQYGHFLAYLRRQSLARLRRKQEEEEGNTDNIEATITLNLNKPPSSQAFQSISNYSLGSLTTDTASMPMISITAKRAGRPLTAYRQLQRSITTYRMNNFRPMPLKNPLDNQMSSSSLLITPRNSVVDDPLMSPVLKPPYELQLNDDMLNYCYISDESGVKYQGQMLSTVV